MPPQIASIQRLLDHLRLDTPLIAVYDSGLDPALEPLHVARGRACVFAFYPRWLEGHFVMYEHGKGGCQGAHRALGLEKEYPPYMAHFLTDGVGAPTGEGLRATPEIAQSFLDESVAPDLSGETVVVGSLKLDLWEKVRTISFLVDPDRLSALMTLAGYWSADTGLVSAPFGSGCGQLWRSVIEKGVDRPVVGGTDIAMRRYLPANTMVFSVSPARFEQMLGFPDDCFLGKDWWNELLDARGIPRKTS